MIATVQTKRGCVFQCIYCSYPYLEGNTYRLRNINTFIKEIKAAKKKLRTNKLFFTDSVFSFPTEFSRQICLKIMEHKLKIHWMVYINPKGLTEELLALYNQSGCGYVILTVDAVTDRLLRAYRKGFTLDEITNSIQMLKKSGIHFVVDIIIGGPGDDMDTIDATSKYCYKYLNGVDVSIMCGMNLQFSNLVRHKTKLEKGISEIADIDVEEALLKSGVEKFQKSKYFFPEQNENRADFLRKTLAQYIGADWRLIGLDPATQSLVDEIFDSGK